MDFNHTDDRRMLKDMVARFFIENYSIEKHHALTDSGAGYTPKIWNKIAELGILGALFSEEDGGFGGAGFDISIVFEEMGRSLVAEPLLSSCLLSGTLLSTCGNSTQKEDIDAIISGELRVSFAHFEPTTRYDISHIETTAKKTKSGWLLNGQKSVVYDVAGAEKLIISARTSLKNWDEGGITLFLVDKSSDMLEIRDYNTIDGLSASEVKINALKLPENAILGTIDQAFPAIELALAKANLALCSEAIGLMDRCREMTIEYMQNRTQFGVPIGKFQALQHRMATVLTEIEQARSSVINAAGRLNSDRITREKAISAAKTLIGKIGRLVGEEAIQIHGGIGMTWELELGHYAKRLIMIDHQFGDVDFHIARYISLSQQAA